MVALIIIFAVVIFATKLIFSSSWFKGKYGEYKVNNTLVSHGFEKRYTISDLIFVSDGKSVQIDNILINKHGLFVIETKNYGGRIYGSDGQHEWTQVIGRTKNKFYNPVKQNATHIYHLKKILPKQVPIFSVVVFIKNNVSYVTSNSVVALSALPEYLSKPRADVLTDAEIDDLYFFFLQLKENCDVSAYEHIESVDNMLKKIDANICPRCGGNLLPRSGRYGQFYGCVNYPDCKFTKNFDI